MRYILMMLFMAGYLFGGVIRSDIVAVDEEKNEAQIKIDKIDVGVSGYIVHHITNEHSSILKNCVVKSFDKETKTAVLELSDFTMLNHNALPHGKWKIEVGDTAELAFGYTRSLLIAPSEEIYYQITKAVKTQWIHPDIFATILSYFGHPTPLQKDFERFGVVSSTGLVFFYLEQKIYTVDIHSFKILHVDDAPLKQDMVKLPFYSRVEKINANWFGEGSDRLESYEPYYYELLLQANPKNKQLHENMLKSTNEKVRLLAKDFVIEEDI